MNYKYCLKIFTALLVLLLFKCSHTEPSKKEAQKEIDSLEYAYEQAVSAYNDDDILKAIEILDTGIEEKQAEIEELSEYREIKEKCSTLLSSIKSNIYIDIESSWDIEGYFYTTLPSDSVTVYTPQFYLYYRDTENNKQIKLHDFNFAFISLSSIDNNDGKEYRGSSDSNGFADSFKLLKSNRFDEVILALFVYINCRKSIQITDSPFLFKYPGMFTVFEIETGEKMSDLSEKLVKNSIILNNSFAEIASLFKFPDYPFIPEPVYNENRFEGLFKPGKYQFSFKSVLPLDYGDNPEEQALDNAAEIIYALLGESEDRFEIEPDSEIYKSIILASIVEKEAASNKYYNEIAAVFYNRLYDNTPLGSCPTVEYALGYHRPFLTEDDISINSPYNVYKYSGLPPTPICFFSDEAFNSVIYPVKSDYYFFVFDWTTGELYFSVTYEGHKENAQIAYLNYISKHGSNSLHEIFYDKFYSD